MSKFEKSRTNSPVRSGGRAIGFLKSSASAQAHYWRNPFVWKRLQKYYKQKWGLLLLSYSGSSPS
jgi:hypothetical protein